MAKNQSYSFTDTDSLTYEIETEDVFKEFLGEQRFD